MGLFDITPLKQGPLVCLLLCFRHFVVSYFYKGTESLIIYASLLPYMLLVVWSSAGLSLLADIFARRFSTQIGRLEGKVALITGAASGIGKETAAKFIQNGAQVVIADIQYQLGQAVANDLGPNAAFVLCDVTKESDISNAVDYTISKYNQLDIMYNNAGIACNPSHSIIDIDLSVFDSIMQTNVRGVIAGIKHASRVMIPRRRGSILCTASITGIMGGLAHPTYSVSKWAVVGIVKSVTAELSKYGIRVNCISPFIVPTPMVMDEMGRIYRGLDKERVKDIIHSAGALEGPECEVNDMANAAVYLASDEAKYVSGHNLVVDGGFTSFKTLGFPAPDQVL